LERLVFEARKFDSRVDLGGLGDERSTAFSIDSKFADRASVVAVCCACVRGDTFVAACCCSIARRRIELAGLDRDPKLCMLDSRVCIRTCWFALEIALQALQSRIRAVHRQTKAMQTKKTRRQSTNGMQLKAETHAFSSAVAFNLTVIVWFKETARERRDDSKVASSAPRSQAGSEGSDAPSVNAKKPGSAHKEVVMRPTTDH
jgi:hypothetical protein